MRIYMFHLMPWPYLPADFAQTHDTAWSSARTRCTTPSAAMRSTTAISTSSSWPISSASTACACNEHHQNAYGLMPSPNIMAACLARRTTRAKLVILGNVLTLYDHPLRVAEEIAMLDVISGGRVVSGQVVGTGNEFFSYNVNPTTRASVSTRPTS